MAARKNPTSAGNAVHTLSIDVGGTGLKAGVLDAHGRLLSDRVRVETPVGATPEVIVSALVNLVRPLPAYQRVSVGFPGVVQGGVVKTAPNLRNAKWHGHDLAGALQRRLNRPVRVINDADMQGLAVIKGRGLEMVCTLGTGFGTGLYLDGQLAPHLEISQHPFRKGETYDQQLGQAARKTVGNARWKRRVKKAFTTLHTLTNFDHLYVGGGNAKHLDFKLPPNISVVSNEAGITGGLHLWKQTRE